MFLTFLCFIVESLKAKSCFESAASNNMRHNPEKFGYIETRQSLIYYAISRRRLCVQNCKLKHFVHEKFAVYSMPENNTKHTTSAKLLPSLNYRQSSSLLQLKVIKFYENFPSNDCRLEGASFHNLKESLKLLHHSLSSTFGLT